MWKRMIFMLDFIRETVQNSICARRLYCINDAKGIESYYDYFASSMTGAGSGYVNAFNGNLVYSVPLISESGTRMPLNISMVYNSANVPIDDLGFGPGWKFSFQQYIEKVEKSDTNAYTYYSYIDADGTEHYFSEYDGKFVDESGSGMVLTDDGTGITLQQEEEKGKAYFKYISGKAYLEYIENESGDRQTLTYSGTKVTKITDGAGREVTVLYGTDRVTGLQDELYHFITMTVYFFGRLCIPTETIFNSAIIRMRSWIISLRRTEKKLFIFMICSSAFAEFRNLTAIKSAHMNIKLRMIIKIPRV